MPELDLVEAWRDIAYPGFVNELRLIHVLLKFES